MLKFSHKESQNPQKQFASFRVFCAFLWLRQMHEFRRPKTVTWLAGSLLALVRKSIGATTHDNVANFAGGMDKSSRFLQESADGATKQPRLRICDEQLFATHVRLPNLDHKLGDMMSKSAFLSLLAACMICCAGCALNPPSQPTFAPASFRSSLPPADAYAPPGGFDQSPARPSLFQQGSSSRGQGSGSS